MEEEADRMKILKRWMKVNASFMRTKKSFVVIPTIMIWTPGSSVYIDFDWLVWSFSVQVWIHGKIT